MSKDLEVYRDIWKCVNSHRIDCNLEPELYSDELEGILFTIEGMLDKYVNHATFNTNSDNGVNKKNTM